MNVGIYIYDDAEVLDFSGPFEVFSTANRLSNPQNVFNVFLVAENSGTSSSSNITLPIKARGGYNVLPHYDFTNHPNIDVLIVVGGVHTHELNKAAVINWVAQQDKSANVVASVCTGAFILAQAGVLNGLNVTTHWEDINDLQQAYPNLTVISGKRWVDEGKYITSGGISAGIDMSLHLVSKLVNIQLAENTAKQMEFDWRKNE
ncbi:DJ-1/PfpI family protein [Psychrosphaera aquimarina]|uniref:DJ-1/PfpI family protein n=1 Tax=Psychrosphaera aquimarina TaxID=2044854 RepID=A0ABU3R3Q6_9GAMM|nr:DJ-1/PfpI family protein [Psychrosphaera aquimarina]MDU0114304.1 DJ-1/PfpI family protein [Psychrosphaera aquimarina]